MLLQKPKIMFYWISSTIVQKVEIQNDSWWFLNTCHSLLQSLTPLTTKGEGWFSLFLTHLVVSLDSLPKPDTNAGLLLWKQRVWGDGCRESSLNTVEICPWIMVSNKKWENSNSTSHHAPNEHSMISWKSALPYILAWKTMTHFNS